LRQIGREDEKLSLCQVELQVMFLHPSVLVEVWERWLVEGVRGWDLGGRW